MTHPIRRLFTILVFAIGLAACDDSTSISSSGGGAQSGDGGSLSARYAGIYRGTLHIRYDGKDFDEKDNLATNLQINRNGTVILTLDGKTVNGVINDRQINVPFKINRKEDGIKCTGDVTLKATVTGNALSGTLNGKGECEVIWVDQSTKITGTINASKF